MGIMWWWGSASGVIIWMLERWETISGVTWDTWTDVWG